MSTTRTFIAIVASDTIRSRVAALTGSLGRGIDGINWVAEDNLHFTLQFLGDVDDATLVAVCKHVEQGAVPFEPFDLRVLGAGAFPNNHRPRTLWLGVEEGREAMIALQESIVDTLTELGIRGERRPFTPHLTLGRIRGSGRAIEPLIGRLADSGEFDAGTMRVKEVTVFASELLRSGPAYHLIATATLKG